MPACRCSWRPEGLAMVEAGIGSGWFGRRALLRGAGTLGLAVVAAPLLEACGHASKQLAFLNWQDYIDPAVLSQFETQTGVSVSYQTYASNDELARLLLLASSARRRGRDIRTYDLIVPSDNFVRRFRTDGLLKPLDHANLPNLANLRPEFRREGFDPANAYTVPWATGSTGI